jgi:hypothetical protein
MGTHLIADKAPNPQLERTAEGAAAQPQAGNVAESLF